MSDLSRLKQLCIVLLLLSLLVAFSVRAAAVLDEVLTDPTMPLNYELPDDLAGTSFIDGLQATLQSYKLNSVLIREQDRIAVINNKRVRVGDSVGNAVVKFIDTDGVTLEVNGEQQVLRLYQGSIKILSGGEGRDDLH